MNKRKVNNQQSARIKKRQQQHCQVQANGSSAITLDGLVILRHARHALIEDATGALTSCSIRPAIDSLVAGDRVVWQKEGDNQGVVVSYYPRHSLLGRPNAQGVIKPIAANVTQLLIVVALQPELSWDFLDRYLVIAEYLKIPAAIVLNKIDLPCASLKSRLLTEYAPLGYPIIFTQQQALIEPEWAAALSQHSSVFVGQSGVGKSSIIARLLPERAALIQTAEISLRSELGCHTTRNSHYYHLPGGGSVLDSPGVREMALWTLPKESLATGYREFQPYLSKCKYRNCYHYNTPGCAILEAVKNKHVTYHRYENYVKMHQSYSE